MRIIFSFLPFHSMPGYLLRVMFMLQQHRNQSNRRKNSRNWIDRRRILFLFFLDLCVWVCVLFLLSFISSHGLQSQYKRFFSFFQFSFLSGYRFARTVWVRGAVCGGLDARGLDDEDVTQLYGDCCQTVKHIILLCCTKIIVIFRCAQIIFRCEKKSNRIHLFKDFCQFTKWNRHRTRIAGTSHMEYSKRTPIANV